MDYLDNVHTVFGEVAEGMDVLMKINEAYCDKEHRPYKDIRYTSPEILGPVQQTCELKIKIIAWVKVFRIIPEFRILRLTFHRKSASKY